MKRLLMSPPLETTECWNETVESIHWREFSLPKAWTTLRYLLLLYKSTVQKFLRSQTIGNIQISSKFTSVNMYDLMVRIWISGCHCSPSVEIINIPSVRDNTYSSPMSPAGLILSMVPAFLTKWVMFSFIFWRQKIRETFGKQYTSTLLSLLQIWCAWWSVLPGIYRK